MSFETADDLAAYFNSDLGAVAATFTPSSGPAIACTVLIRRPQETSGVGIAGISTYNTQILVRLSEVTDPSAGRFSGAAGLGGLVYMVSDTDLDELGAIWTCHCTPTT